MRDGQGESATMPSHDGVRRDDLKGASPVPPQPREEHPEAAIGVIKPRAPRRLALEDGELMPEGENLRPELETRPNDRPEGGEEGREQCGHPAADLIGLGP